MISFRHSLLCLLFLATFVGGGTHIVFGDENINPADMVTKELELKTKSPINLVPYIAVYKDPEGRETIQSITTRFLQNERPRSRQDNLFIADRKAPVWIAIPIRNSTDQTLWTIDFGTRASGRTAQFVSLMVAEQTSNQTFFREENRSANAPTSIINAHHIAVRLNKDVSSLLILRMMPNDKTTTITPITLHASINPVPSYGWLTFTWVLIIAGIVAAGALTAIACLSGRYIVLIPAAYALILPLVLFTPMSLLPTVFDRLIPAPNLYYILISFLFTQSVVSIARLSGLRFSYGTATAVVFGIHALFLLGTFLITSTITLMPVFRLIMISPSLILASVCAYMCLRESDRIGLIITALTVVHTTGILVQILTNGGILPAWPVGVNALPTVGLLVDIILFAALQHANVFNEVNEQQKKRRRNPNDQAALANLRNAKESFDYSNLLKVIEHERKQLADARIRESVRSEEMRKAKDEADQANRAKSAFLAVISHEIRTPMTGVLGMVKLLIDTTLTKTQRDYVDTIKESGNAMMGLLNDILDFEKIESGKMQIEAIDFDLHRLIASVQTLMNGHATTKNLALIATVAPNVPQYVIGDMLRLRQILLNLIGNAIKFTKSGSVTISVSKLDSTNNGAGPQVHQIYFSITDTGIGISAEAQKNIFNPFSQADKTIARKFGGSGLGLAISKKLLEVMGSQINIKSREGIGTTFFFNLSMMQGDPALVEEQIAPTAEDKNQNSMPQLRLLIVEDNVITQRVLRTLAEQFHHDVTVAGSGEEALPFLKMGEKFDVIFTDIQMDGMTGYEFARAVRIMNDEDMRNVPIIALTGNVERSDITSAYESGMTGHLAKPIDTDAFEKVLRDIATARGTTTRGNTDNANTKKAKLPENAQMDILVTLRESLGDAQLKELLNGLYAKTDEIMTTLGKTSMDDLPSIRDRAHELKGMCGNFGLGELSDLARDIEQKAKNAESDGMIDLIKKLPATYSRSRQMIDTWMKD